MLEAFARYVMPGPGLEDVRLALVGPSVAGVTDDPEGQQVLAECTARWAALPAEQRRRISLVSLPTADVEENAAVVNAVQRHATVVVQKSLVEGFGLTVSEAMWKSRPVVASGVGGILDQITDGEQGLLIGDPTDLEAFSAGPPPAADRRCRSISIRCSGPAEGQRTILTRSRTHPMGAPDQPRRRDLHRLGAAGRHAGTTWPTGSSTVSSAVGGRAVFCGRIMVADDDRPEPPESRRRPRMPW